MSETQRWQLRFVGGPYDGIEIASPTPPSAHWVFSSAPRSWVQPEFAKIFKESGDIPPTPPIQTLYYQLSVTMVDSVRRVAVYTWAGVDAAVDGLARYAGSDDAGKRYLEAIRRQRT